MIACGKMKLPLKVPGDINKYFFNRVNDLKYVKGYMGIKASIM